MTGFKSKRAAALDEEGMYLVHQTDHSDDNLHMVAQPAQEPVAWKLMPRDATDAMLKAMDECSTEGYDERLYAGHAASVYMAAWDASDTAYRPSGLARSAQEQVARIAVLEAALNEIAYAGMSVSHEMSDDYKQAWHASRAWEFIGIAAQAIDQESTPAQEPVAWQFMNGSTFRKRRPEDFSDLAPDGFPYWKPLYTTLPVAKRPWVGLTDEEAQWLYDNCRTQSNLIDMTEAKLKDKNNG